MRIDRKNFSFTLLDTETKAFCFINRELFDENSLLENIKQCVFDMSFLTQKYAQTNLIYVSTDFEFVPAYIFEKQYKNSLYQLSHSDNKGKILTSRSLLKDSVTLFDIDFELYDFLQRSMLDIKYHHHLNVLASHFHQKTRIPSLNSQAFIHFDKDRCDFFFFRNQKLVHTTSYYDLKEEDLAFHFLSLWEKADYKQLDDILYLSGTSPHKEPILNILKEYIQKIEEVGIPSDSELLGSDAKLTPLDLLVLSL